MQDAYRIVLRIQNPTLKAETWRLLFFPVAVELSVPLSDVREAKAQNGNDQFLLGH
jgi:hypothetical protein